MGWFGGADCIAPGLVGDGWEEELLLRSRDWWYRSGSRGLWRLCGYCGFLYRLEPLCKLLLGVKVRAAVRIVGGDCGAGGDIMGMVLSGNLSRDGGESL